MTGEPVAADVIVVGSGFGGAVTAARLAEHGLRVLVLERGPWWGAHDHGPEAARSRSFPRGVTGMGRLVRTVRWSGSSSSGAVDLRRDGLWELHQFERLSCLVANGVGGGSLVYTNMQVSAPDAYFDRFPAEITAAEMKPHYDAVAQMLRPAPDPARHPKTAAFAGAIAAMGRGGVQYPDLAIDFEAPRSDTGAAATSCLLGSGDATKRSLDRTYLLQALRHGAQIRALCEVTAISRDTLAGWQVRYRDHRHKRTHVAQAPRLVLAAGTLGTLRLLFAARDRHHTLPQLPESLGRGFTPNGDMASFLYRADVPINSDIGPTISAYHRPGDDGRDYLTGEFGLPLHALALPKGIHTRASQSLILFSMGADTIAATMTYDGQELRTSTSQDDDPELFARLHKHARAIAAGYRPRRTLLNAPFRNASNRMLSVHPLGGAPIGTNPTDAVVDHTGQVFGHRGLYIADGTILPAAPGIPPSMTIAALAERQSALISSAI